MTLSVPACLLLTVFFYDLIPTFVKRYTWLFYPPCFPSYGQITHTILVRWHRDGLPLFLSILLWNYSNDCIEVYPWVSAVNSPLFFVAWPVFELSFYCRQIFLLFFWSTTFARDGLLLWKERKSTEYAFICILFLVNSIVPHNIRKCCKSPVELKPLASTDFFIAADDTNGGSGSNFIVEWVAEKTVYEPVIEAVMISTSSSQGISFVSPAKILKQHRMQKWF